MDYLEYNEYEKDNKRNQTSESLSLGGCVVFLRTSTATAACLAQQNRGVPRRRTHGRLHAALVADLTDRNIVDLAYYAALSPCPRSRSNPA